MAVEATEGSYGLNSRAILTTGLVDSDLNLPTGTLPADADLVYVTGFTYRKYASFHSEDAVWETNATTGNYLFREAFEGTFSIGGASGTGNKTENTGTNGNGFYRFGYNTVLQDADFLINTSLITGATVNVLHLLQRQLLKAIGTYGVPKLSSSTRATVVTTYGETPAP